MSTDEVRQSTQAEESALGLKFRVLDKDPSDAKRPLVLLVHGRAGDSKVMWIFAKAFASANPLIIAPQGEVDDFGDRTPDQPGFSWWPIHPQPALSADSATKALRLQEVEQSLLKLKGFIDRLSQHFNFDPSKIYASGFSQGGAVVGSLSLFYPELFNGVAILGGFIPYAIVNDSKLVNSSIRDRTQTISTKYFFFHGTEDKALTLARNEESRSWLLDHGADIVFMSDNVGHKVSSGGIRALTQWFDELVANS
jgi:phospholipase/carboxylesterase